jgi:hypothetical protein
MHEEYQSENATFFVISKLLAELAIVKVFSKFRQTGGSENEDNSSDCDNGKGKTNLKRN